MLYSNKENLELIITKMLKVLAIPNTTIDHKISTVLFILYVSNLMQQQELEELFAIKKADDRKSFLHKELVKLKIDKWEANIITEDLSRLSQSELLNLFELSYKCELPNYDLVKYLIDFGQSQGLIGRERVSIELADLAFSVACKFDFDKEDIEDDCQDLECLCLGGLAESFAIRAGNSHNAKYETRGTGIGATFKKILIKLSGGTIDYEHQEIPNLKLKKEKQFFNVGFLSDMWGLKSWGQADETQLSSFTPSMSDIRYLEEILERVDGVVVCLLPSSWLNKTSGSDAEFKMHLIQAGVVEAVIQLPERIMAATSLAPNLLILNTRQKQTQIKFVNASDEPFYSDENRSYRKLINTEQIVSLYTQNHQCDRTAIVDNKQVLENKGILSAKRYVSSKNQETIDDALNQYPLAPLSNVADIMRCHMIKPNDDNLSNEVSEIGPINIDNYFQINESKPFKQFTYSDADTEKVKKQTLQKEDIVFVMKGSVGKVALIGEQHEGFIANQSFVIIRLKGNDDVDSIADEPSITSSIVLFRYLSSDIARELISSKFSGTTVPMVKMQDLKELSIPIPSIEEQKSILDNQNKLLDLLEQKKLIEDKIGEQFNSVWGIAHE